MTNIIKNNQGLSKILMLVILGIIAAIIFAVVIIIIQSQSAPNPKSVKLKMWGVWDETSDLSKIISAYQKAHPYVSIEYSKKRYEEYEDLLVNGWANEPNTGPDIYAIPNSWVNKYQKSFIKPLPKTTEVAFFKQEKFLFKEETRIKYITETSLTPSDIQREFIDVVYDDIIVNNKIYALPLGINTLVMFYNKDLLNQAHMPNPPSTWNEFASAVSQIAIVDDRNNVTRAGAALGTYNNVPQVSDIVSLLMLQNGTAMTTGNKITFHLPSSSDASYYPSHEALRFYSDFASPEKLVYTWNDQMPDALDFFADGKLAFLFDYKYNEDEIIQKSRGVDYSIAPVPQVSPQNEINLANYWVYTVSKKTANYHEAWNFLQYAAEARNVKTYLEKSQQSSVLRTLLNDQLSDPDQAMFAEQALTAESWYHGKSPSETEEYFIEMINNVINETMVIKDAVTLTVKKIQQVY